MMETGKLIFLEKAVSPMSFFSGSYKRKPYKYGKHGSTHYQRKGILGKLFHILESGSRPHSYSRYPHQQHAPSEYGHSPAKTATCKSCQSVIPAEAKFCPECGAKAETAVFCSNCGEKLPPDAKFCSNCGAKTDS